MQNPDRPDPFNAALTHFPKHSRGKALIGCRWSRMEVQGGNLTHKSRGFPGAWSTSSLRIQACDDVLIVSESYECNGEEIFGLRLLSSADPWSVKYIESVRPAFGAILTWPAGLHMPPRFSETGPNSGEAGLGQAVRTSSIEASVPLLWLFLRAGDDGLLVFADTEIPLNVGVAGPAAVNTVTRALQARSIIKL
jgi:hypothetical protein